MTGGTLPIRAFQWDLGRQIERLDWLIAQLPRYAAWGYQELYLHLEDAVEFPSLPGVARQGAYSTKQFGRLVEAAARSGIGVVPIVNLLGHTQYLIKLPSLRDLNECRAPDGSPLEFGQICPLHPRTLEVADALIGDMEPFCSAGKVHVGLDESYHLGRHPLSRAEIASVGLEGHFARYVGRLHGLAEGRGLRLGIWADMLALLPAAIAQLPQGIIAYDWYYYPFKRLPRIELRNFSDYDLEPALRARGVEYWGCPMNGSFRHEPMPLFSDRLANIVSWWDRCLRTKAAGILMTSWESNRLAADLPVAVDAAAAGLWLDDERDPDRLLAAGCRRLFGKRGRRIATMLTACDSFPFSGYPRWQVNDRWDTVLNLEPLKGWKAGAKRLAALARAAGPEPAVRASIAYRAYLAERDLFVRDMAQSVWRARQAGPRAKKILAEMDRTALRFSKSLRPAKSAARVMWRLSRDRGQAGPNEHGVDSDALRLKALRGWIQRCRADLSIVHSASVVAGTWQLLFTALNFAPAVQKIVVQAYSKEGAWKDVHGLFTIEFQSVAARPRTRRIHTLSVPVDWELGAGEVPRLRIVVRGFGQLAFRNVVLTDGVRSLPGRLGKKALGKKAPARSYPDFDWGKDRGADEVTFGPITGRRAGA